MANIQYKSSVLAIKVESTEGTPVVPTSGANAVALQEDFSMTPGIETQENNELRASIGKAKSIPGKETPSASLTHYLRHSGVEGQAPNFGPVLKSFFGTEVVAGTEYDTASGSTTTVIAFPSGEGTNFQRGQGLLLKDSANGYRIRAIHSMSSDNATLGFKVPTAPASGVNTGKCVLYKPANTDHPSLTLWHYLGNGGGVQMMAGARAVSLDIEVNAGELINFKSDFEGLSYYYDPIEITSSTKYLDFTDDDGTFAAIIAPGYYKTPKALASAISAAMDAANSGETHTCTYSDTTGRFTIISTGTVLTLKWNTGSNTANTIATKIGFSAAGDSSGTAATTGYTSATAQDYAFSYTASYDNADPLAAKYQEVMIGDQTDYACFGASTVNITGKLTRATLDSICAESGVEASLITADRKSVV